MWLYSFIPLAFIKYLLRARLSRLMSFWGLLWLKVLGEAGLLLPDCAFVWLMKRPALQVHPALQAWRSQNEVPRPPGRGSSSPGHIVFGEIWAPLNFLGQLLLRSEQSVQEFKAALSRSHNPTLLLLGQTFNLPLTTCLSSQSWPYTPTWSLMV